MPRTGNPSEFDESVWRKTADELRLRAAFTPAPPISARMPVSYQTVPAPARRMIAGVIGRVQRMRQESWSSYPGWPIDLSADLAADLANQPSIRFQRTPLLLSHDIDSLEGLHNLARMFLPIEERVAARSANYIVPCAWPLDHAILADIEQRGHEIGVHGYNHANRTPFVAAAERQERLASGYALSKRYKIAGYRAPSLLRTKELLTDLGRFYRYDSSIPTSGGAFPVPNNGCASARPWQLGSLWEIPLSMPRDGSLKFLGHSPNKIGQIWRHCAEIISRSGGIACLLTHCESGFSGNVPMLHVYREFLESIANDSRFEFVRPVDLLDRIETAEGARAVH